MSKRPLWHPTLEQELLLKMSLVDNLNEAKSYWKQWESSNNISDLQVESYLILQSAICNLLRLGAGLPQKMRRISHHTSVRNLVVLKTAQKITGEFSNHKIPLFALKGLALYAAGIYPRSNMRAMHDIDLYVNENHHKKAIEILTAGGWSISAKYDHAVVLTRKGFPGSLDLHQRPVWFRLSPKIVSLMENDTESITLGDGKVSTMKPELQLAHLIIHGARGGANDYSAATISHLRWIIDIHYLIKGKKINWKRLLIWAKKLEAGMQISNALDYASSNFGVEIPEFILDELRSIPKTRIQKLHAHYSMTYTEPKFFKIPRRLQSSFHAWLLFNRSPEYINSLNFKNYMSEFGQFLREGFSLSKNQSIASFIIKKILTKPRLLLP